MPASRETRRLEQELHDQLRRLTNRQVRDLVAAWAVAWDEISQDLTPVLADMLVAGERVTAGQMIRSTKLRRALTVVAGRLEVLAAATGVRITRDLRDVIDTAGWAQASVIDSQLPPDSNLVDLQAWARVDPRQVDAIVSRSTQQITSRTRELGPVAAQAVRRELVRGVAVGSNPRVTARRILDRAREEFAGGLTRAMTIARTEILDAHRAAAAVGQAQHADVLAGWMWLAALSSRTCPACFALHGTIHDLDEPGPEGHQNCRCARSPVVKPWRELGIDVPEPAPLVQDADAYFAGLTPRQQQDILGKRGYQAWLAGRWPRSRWAVKRSTDGWRDSWVVARPPKLVTGGSGSRRVPPPKGPILGAYDGPGAPKPGRVTRDKGARVEQHERLTAYRLASLGLDVHFRRPSTTPGIKTADAVVLGEVWEFKATTGASRGIIGQRLSDAHHQADQAVLDLVSSPLELTRVRAEIATYWRQRVTRNALARVWVLPKDVGEHFTLERPR